MGDNHVRVKHRVSHTDKINIIKSAKSAVILDYFLILHTANVLYTQYIKHKLLLLSSQQANHLCTVLITSSCFTYAGMTTVK